MNAAKADLSTDVLIVGGGLAGLALAWQCQQRGINYQLVEARDRWGGRVLSHAVTLGQCAAHVDVGPSWFWPGQPRIAQLIGQLNLRAFDQFSHGATAFEDERGHVSRNQGYASMQGAFRLAGGMGALTTALSARLEPSRIALNCPARKISPAGEALVTEVAHGAMTVRRIQSRRVVLAVPPRVIAKSIQLDGIVNPTQLAALQSIPTWMAVQAKVVAVYERPFWREAGWSGDAMSRHGPLVEIHDASGEPGTPDALYALFGFVGVPAAARHGQPEALLAHAKLQLARMFGEAALQPVKILLQDWADEQHTATPLDAKALAQHPDYGLPAALATLADGRLILVSSEVANEFGGYLEGALCAADTALHELGK
jgi:monoamine oxidase